AGGPLRVLLVLSTLCGPEPVASFGPLGAASGAGLDCFGTHAPSAAPQTTAPRAVFPKRDLKTSLDILSPPVAFSFHTRIFVLQSFPHLGAAGKTKSARVAGTWLGRLPDRSLTDPGLRCPLRPRTMKHKPTIAEVAKAANVAGSTVSRVLNGGYASA